MTQEEKRRFVEYIEILRHIKKNLLPKDKVNV